MKGTFRHIGLKKILIAVLTLCMCLTAFALTGCGGGNNPEPSGKTVASIEIVKNPDKTSYFVGEEFTAEGGEIKVTYSDDTTETKKMTDEGVTLSAVTIDISDPQYDSEEKTVTVTYGEKRARFTITVAYELFNVTFDYGFDDMDDLVVEVRKGEAVDEPEEPKHDGYNFDVWCSDESKTVPYDFEDPVEGDITIYAKWMDASTHYYTVEFDYNFASSPNAIRQQVEEGATAQKPAVDPKRTGYKFAGWYSDDDCTTEYDFANAIGSNTTVYAKWEKLPEYEGVHEYKFEAEDMDLSAVSGNGASGTTSGTGMIQYLTGVGASGDRWVGYLYDLGVTLKFSINSDKTVHNVKLTLSLSAEFRDFTMTYDTYQILVNNEVVKYDPIAFTDVPESSSDSQSINVLPFKDYVIADDITLYEGLNVITLVTNNTDALSGTTMNSAAPLVDCLKLECDAVLDWTARLGLPADNY